jgi:hypothetical protein
MKRFRVENPHQVDKCIYFRHEFALGVAEAGSRSTGSSEPGIARRIERAIG